MYKTAPGRPRSGPGDSAQPVLAEFRLLSSVLSSLLNGASRTRTGGLLGAIQALSQLSYSPANASVLGLERYRPPRCFLSARLAEWECLMTQSVSIWI